jgi:hypothetical protein
MSTKEIKTGNEVKIVNPEIDYCIVSFSHTNKTDKYITLWRPDNAGYCYPISFAGRYKGYERGYHDSDGNIPVPIVAIPKSFIVLDDRERPCIKNTRTVIAFINLYK